MIRNHPSCGGWIEAICGPMFSGKSEELIRRLRRAEIAGQAVMIAKPISDDRYDLSHVVSHSGHRIRAAGIEDPGALAPLAAEYDVLGIDEVQFFPGSVVEVCVALADRGVIATTPSFMTAAPSRSVPCPSCWHAPTWSTSCRPCACGAAARRR